jgi:surfeit locus 1 family protein
VTDPVNEPATAAAARPRGWRRELVVLLAALAGVAIAARLGFWQLDRAHQKEAMEAARTARQQEPPLGASDLATGPKGAAAQVYRRVRVTGRWVDGRTVYLDNRQMDGKVGFYVVTPLLLEGSSRAVLVQRGWVLRDFAHYETLPKVETPSGPTEVEGSVAASPSRMLELGTPASGAIRQNADPLSFARETGLDLLPLAVIESATPRNARDGLGRHWAPPATGVQTNYGYAFQWFALGTVIAFLYVWFRIVLPLRRRRVA